MVDSTCTLNEELYACKNLDDYIEYENELFDLFLKIYTNDQLYFKGMPIRLKYFPPEYSEKSSFYHLTCEDFEYSHQETERKPNFERMKRVTWPRKIIECGNDEKCHHIKIWENSRGNHKNILILCDDLEYVVVLGKRNNYLLLITAYPLTRPHRKKTLLKEYENYINANNAPFNTKNALSNTPSTRGR